MESDPPNESQKNDHVHELDAVVSHLYGLSERHLAHIFETFDVGCDYGGRLDENLRHFRALRKLA